MHTKQIKIIVDTDNPSEKAGIVLEDALIGSEHTPILLLVSGGSSMHILDNVAPDILGAHITVAVLDERFDRDPAINNFTQLKGTRFYTSAKEHGVSFIDTFPEEGDTLRSLAERFERELRAWRDENPKGIVIVTLGMGADGHVAGIMPYPKDGFLFNALFSSSEHWAVGYDAEEKNTYPLRMTVTNTYLRDEVGYAIWHVVGDEKGDMLMQALENNEKINMVPARIVHIMKEVVLVTDHKID